MCDPDPSVMKKGLPYDEFNELTKYREKTTIIGANHSFYEGQVVDGKKDGVGCCKWDGGDTYTGQFTKGKRHGFGIYKWADGSAYQGTWKNDK